MFTGIYAGGVRSSRSAYKLHTNDDMLSVRGKIARLEFLRNLTNTTRSTWIHVSGAGPNGVARHHGREGKFDNFEGFRARSRLP
jgi:hypothetical protein